MNCNEIMYNGYSYPVYELDEDLDIEIQDFCFEIIDSGAWVTNSQVLAQLVISNAWEEFSPFDLEDEASCSHLYAGCAEYIWMLMPEVYRQHIINETEYEHFHIVAHNFFEFEDPADWFNVHSDLAMSIASARMNEIYGCDHDVEQEEGHE